MKVLIAGGAGFIGSRVATELQKKGANVTILDDLSTGSVANLESGVAHSGVELIVGSINDDRLLRKVFVQFDCVFNLAGVSSVVASWEDPVGTGATNLEGCLKLLVASRDAKVRRFILASSAAVYGDTRGQSASERMPLFPMSPYGLQKYAAELYCRMFSSEFGLFTVCLRYFNVYGPGQQLDLPSAGVIPRYVLTALNGGAPIIYGDGSQRRDFIHISDVARATILAAEAPETNLARKVYNIGSGVTHSLSELIAIISNISGKPLTPKFESRRKGDIDFSQAQIEAARSDLGFSVEIPLEQGVRETWTYYAKQATGPFTLATCFPVSSGVSAEIY